MVYDEYAFNVPAPYQVRVIIDTDAKNEADDQFAIVHALLSPKFDNVGFIAAHDGICKATDSMLRSHAEPQHLFKLMDKGGGPAVPQRANRPHL